MSGVKKCQRPIGEMNACLPRKGKRARLRFDQLTNVQNLSPLDGANVGRGKSQYRNGSPFRGNKLHFNTCSSFMTMHNDSHIIPLQLLLGNVVSEDHSIQFMNHGVYSF